MKTTFRFQLAAITLAALAAVWFWALPAILTPLFYLHPSNWTDADLVRHLWHFRLVQPEWVSSPPQYDYLRWAHAETLIRLALVLLGWQGASTWLVRRSCAGGLSHRPTRRLQATARLRLCSMPDAWAAPCLSR